jgi:hypothetical protein
MPRGCGAIAYLVILAVNALKIAACEKNITDTFFPAYHRLLSLMDAN